MSSRICTILQNTDSLYLIDSSCADINPLPSPFGATFPAMEGPACGGIRLSWGKALQKPPLLPKKSRNRRSFVFGRFMNRPYTNTPFQHKSIFAPAKMFLFSSLFSLISSLKKIHPEGWIFCLSSKGAYKSNEIT